MYSCKAQEEPIILAVDPGARRLGFAVLCGKELLYYGVKTVGSGKSPHDSRVESMLAFIKNIFETYQPKVLAIETLHGAQTGSALLVKIAGRVKAAAAKARLLVCEYAPSGVRKRLCGSSGKAT